MKVLATAALIGGILALGGSTALAQSAPAVEHSGRVFHIRACPSFEGPQSARCYAHIVTDSRGNILSRAALPNTTPAGYSPNQLRGAYGIIGSGSAATTVAIVDAYGYPNAASDLAVYRTQFGLGAASLTIVNQSGGTKPPKTNNGWDQEQALDLDMVSSMCPNCKILLVQASSASFSNLGAAANYAAAHASVVSNSYGGGESGSSAYEADYNHPGIAVTASAGDSGYGAQFPATSPHVIAVGGTSLNLSGNTRVSETVWSGTGSGCSAIYGKPTWQHDPLCGFRMETDVSAVADPNTGVAVYGPGSGGRSGWLVFGGTSVAAPLIGGIYGEKSNEATACATNPAFTESCASSIYANASALNDIAPPPAGSNGNCGGSYFCTVETGYDGPTGLGTPKGDTAF